MKILIVEDEPVAGFYAEAIIKKSGFEVADVIKSAAEAVDYVQKYPVDLLILDINLNGPEDGIDAARRVKSIMNIPVIYITAYPDSETLIRALETDPHAYLIKPFNKVQMNIAIRLAFQKHALQANLLESQRQLRQLNRKQEEAREMERKRIAQEVHDAIGQELVGFKLTLQHMSRLLDSESKEYKEIFQNHTLVLADSVERMMDHTEKLTSQLRPPFIEEIGIIGSISKEVERLNLVTDKTAIQFSHTGEELNMDSNLLLSLYRIFQEATTNALKHSYASHIDINIISESDTVTLIVKDDGQGFNVKNQNGNRDTGMGLISMRERAQGIEGDFKLTSSSGSGTTITVILPLHEKLKL